MKYCSYCGNQIRVDQDVCLNCGVFTQNRSNSNVSSDSGSIGWALLGFFIPLAGIILYFLWRDQQPNNSRLSGKGALVGVLVFGLLMIWYVMFMYSIYN